MRVVEVVCSRSVRVNLGNYEGVDLFVSMKAEVGPGETEKDVYKELRGTVDAAACDQVVRHLKARGKRAEVANVRRQYGLAER